MSTANKIANETRDEEPDKQVSVGTVSWIRAARLWSGMILFVFLTMHLLNHALGLFGLAALDIGQTIRWAVWMNPGGNILLYSALAVHFLLACWRIVTRRTLRMPPDEAIQLMLGLLIPILLLPHVVHTRIAGMWFGGSGFYEPVLRGLWPDQSIWQIALVIVAWSHGVIGIAMAFRHRPWFQRIRTFGLALAVILPTLAIAGFIAGGREVALLPKPAAKPGQTEMRVELMAVQQKAWYMLGGVGLALLLAVKLGYFRRRIGNKITVNYRGRGPIRVSAGSTVLEASRINDIPHPSLCRGRGRCSTCRVQILSDLEDLPPPSDLEKATLDRVGAVRNVRLACQLRPQQDISLRILLPVLGRADDPETQAEAERWAVERVATILALDLHAFNVLVKSRLPYELVALVNRFGSEMRQAVEQRGGKISNFYGDGLVAVFDDPDNERAGARNALAAARDMDRVLRILNREMGGALPIPVRAGIGIHSGQVTLARVGSTDRHSDLMAFGASVKIAGGLQMSTKALLADCICSEATAKLAKLDVKPLSAHEVHIDGEEGTIRAYAISNWEGTLADDLKPSPPEPSVANQA